MHTPTLLITQHNTSVEVAKSFDVYLEEQQHVEGVERDNGLTSVVHYLGNWSSVLL